MRSDFLCSACNEKVKTERLDKLTLDVIRFLGSLEDKYKNLRDAEVRGVIDLGKAMIIIAGRGSGGKIVGRGGVIAKDLNSRFGMVRVVEEGTREEMIQSLLFPVKPIGVNKVYGAGGERYKLRVKMADKKKIPMGNDEFREMTKKLGAEAEIFFE